MIPIGNFIQDWVVTVVMMLQKRNAILLLTFTVILISEEKRLLPSKVGFCILTVTLILIYMHA